MSCDGKGGNAKRGPTGLRDLQSGQCKRVKCMGNVSASEGRCRVLKGVTPQEKETTRRGSHAKGILCQISHDGLLDTPIPAQGKNTDQEQRNFGTHTRTRAQSGGIIFSSNTIEERPASITATQHTTEK